MTFHYAFAVVSFVIGGVLALLDLSLKRKLREELPELGSHIPQIAAFLEQQGLLELARDHAGRIVGIVRSPFPREMEEEWEPYLLDPIRSVELGPLSNKRVKLPARVD